MLEPFSIPQLEDVPNIMFQQAGAPPHWSSDVCQCLDEHFLNRWLGRGGPIQLPPSSPDSTHFDTDNTLFK